MKFYFDNATASPPSKSVSELLKKGDWISPFSPYGEKEIRALNETKETLSNIFSLQDEGSLFFAPSRIAATDAIFRFVYEEWGRGFGKNHFLTSTIEEASQIFSITHLEALGGRGTLVPVNEKGQLTKELLQASLTPRSSLLSLSLGNGVLGTVHPVEELWPHLDDRGVLLHLDLSHVIGKIEMDPLKLHADFITFSLETLHGPRGGAILWSKRPLRGGDLLFGSEPGAIGLLDAPRFHALGMAAKEGIEYLPTLQLEGTLIREQFEEGLKELLPDIQILFKETLRLPTTSVISFPGVRSEALLFALNEKGVKATMGGGSFQMIHHLLKACHFSSEIAETALSFTFSRMHQTDEIQEALKIIQDAYLTLKKLSVGLL